MSLRKGVSWPIPVLTVVTVIWIIPVFAVIMMSLRPATEFMRGWWILKPLTINLHNYITVWTKFQLGRATLTSFEISIGSTVPTIAFCSLAAYAFEFLDFPGRRLFLLLFVNAFILPMQILLIPLLIMWRQFHLTNNLLAVVLPNVALSFTWTIIYFKAFLFGFPNDLIDAAKIDGCKHFRIYWNIVMPNSFAPVASIGILQFLFSWNGLLFPLLFLRKDFPLTVALIRIRGQYEPNWEYLTAATIIVIIVPLLVYVLLQRYFAEGLSRSGSEK
jgi:alpha-glucoside transport system permease protein